MIRKSRARKLILGVVLSAALLVGASAVPASAAAGPDYVFKCKTDSAVKQAACIAKAVESCAAIGGKWEHRPGVIDCNI